jgi:hypothetical protein
MDLRIGTIEYLQVFFEGLFIVPEAFDIHDLQLSCRLIILDILHHLIQYHHIIARGEENGGFLYIFLR